MCKLFLSKDTKKNSLSANSAIPHRLVKATTRNYNLATMSDLNVSFAGLSLRYPFVVETISANISTSVVQRISDAPTGAIVMAPFEPAPPTSALPSGEYATANRSGRTDGDTEEIVRGLDADSYIETLEAVCAASSVPIIAPLRVSRRRTVVSYAQMMMDAGAAAIELRPFEEYAYRSLRSDQIEKNVLRIAAAISDGVDLPITVRVPATAYGIEAFVQALGACGVRGIVIAPFDDLGAINTDLTKVESDSSNAEEAVAGFQMTLAVARRLYRRVTPHVAVPIPPGRGKSAIEALLSGATVVTLPVDLSEMQKSVATVSSHARNVQGWMGSRRHDSLFDFRGMLSESRLTSSLENR